MIPFFSSCGSSRVINGLSWVPYSLSLLYLSPSPSLSLVNMTNDDICISDITNNERTNFNNLFANANNENDDNDEFDHGVQDSLYFTEEEYTSLLSKHKMNDTKNLKIISMNIANLFSKLSGLKSLVVNLSNTSNKPNIIVITETHIPENHDLGDAELKNYLGINFTIKGEIAKEGVSAFLWITIFVKIQNWTSKVGLRTVSLKA